MYTYNGENFTLDEIKMILGVEEITDAILAENGITLAEEATQVPDESKTVVEAKTYLQSFLPESYVDKLPQSEKDKSRNDVDMTIKPGRDLNKLK